jgi:hypothetical protein
MRTELGAKDLLNSRLAYVAVSRGARDAQIFTNDAATLGHELNCDVSMHPRFSKPRSHRLSSSSPPKRTRSVKVLVWACNPDPSRHSPDSSSVAEARPESRPRCARRVRGRRALTPATQPRLIILISGECHQSSWHPVRRARIGCRQPLSRSNWSRVGRFVVAPDNPSSLKSALHQARFKAASCKAVLWSSVDTRA